MNPAQHLLPLFLMLALGACSTSPNPWENRLDWKPAPISAVTVFRTPDDRLCGFLDGRYNSNGSMLTPGSIACDDGHFGSFKEIYTGSTVGRSIIAPGAPAFVFPPNAYRFDVRSGALIEVKDPNVVRAAAIDGRGRVMMLDSGKFVRVEPEGTRTPLFGSALPGEFALSPDDRIYVTPLTGPNRIVEVVNQQLVPILTCPNAVMPNSCAGATMIGFDRKGSAYLMGPAPAAETYEFARIDPDRTVHRLPDGPKAARFAVKSLCSVTGNGGIVCSYEFEETPIPEDGSEVTENWSNHFELIELGSGASAWTRIGLMQGPDVSPFYLTARDGGDVLAGDFSGGAATHILNLVFYHY